MTALYATIFGTAFSRYYDGSIPRYVLSAFVAVVCVTFFLQSTNEALASVVANGGLLNKIAIKPEIFPLASIGANTFQQCLTTFPAMLVMSFVVTHDPIRVVLVPVVLGGLILLCTGLALALSALFVFFRDLANVWSLIGFVLWMTSPVFYPAEVVPASVQPYLAVNPIAQAVTALRDVVLGSGPIDFARIGLTVLAGIVVLAAGAVLFRSLKHDFMDLL
jgi:ABC-type polysaccharide/polyol phosphate export permease